MDGRQGVNLLKLLNRGGQILRYSFRYPHLIPIVAWRLNTRILSRIGLFKKPDIPSQKRLIHSRDWDILIVLDACRFDAYLHSSAKKFGGDIKAVWSPASITPHWVVRTWLEGDWRDTLYISGNVFINKSLGFIPHLHRMFRYDLRGRFLDIVEVWRKEVDRELHTVPPWNMYRAFKRARLRMRLRGLKLGRDYRMVIHFIQPHTPFITYKKLNNLIYILDDIIRGESGGLGFEYLFIPYLRRYIGKKDLDSIMWKGYMDNLEIALEYVKRIVEESGARVAITADHGELLGEYNSYFHFDIKAPQLRIVPYHVVSQ